MWVHGVCALVQTALCRAGVLATSMPLFAFDNWFYSENGIFTWRPWSYWMQWGWFLQIGFVIDFVTEHPVLSILISWVVSALVCMAAVKASRGGRGGKEYAKWIAEQEKQRNAHAQLPSQYSAYPPQPERHSPQMMEQARVPSPGRFQVSQPQQSQQRWQQSKILRGEQSQPSSASWTLPASQVSQSPLADRFRSDNDTRTETCEREVDDDS